VNPTLAPRSVWICVNGIHANPGDSDGWTDRAVTWLHLHTDTRAEKWEYAASWLTRRLHQQARAEAIATMVRFYADQGFKIAFLAHSNGADLFERVLKLIAPIKIEAAHLIAPACKGETLEAALEVKQLGWLHLYGSPNDSAMKLAKLSQQLVGWAGLGYGDLGGRVSDFATHAPRTTAYVDETETHSSWFQRGDSFERTMRLVARDIIQPSPVA